MVVFCFLEDLFLGGQSSIILGYRRLSLFSLFLQAQLHIFSFKIFLMLQHMMEKELSLAHQIGECISLKENSNPGI